MSVVEEINFHRLVSYFAVVGLDEELSLTGESAETSVLKLKYRPRLVRSPPRHPGTMKYFDVLINLINLFT